MRSSRSARRPRAIGNIASKAGCSRQRSAGIFWRTVTRGYFARSAPGSPRPCLHRRGSRRSIPVAVINATLAALLWPDADRLGKSIGTGLEGTGASLSSVSPRTCPRKGSAARDAGDVPAARSATRFRADAMSIVVRTEGDPARLAAAAPSGGSRDSSAGAGLSDPADVDCRRHRCCPGGDRRADSGFFGALALVLAAVGLHGVTARSSTIEARTRIRIALGAEPARSARWSSAARSALR